MGRSAAGRLPIRRPAELEPRRRTGLVPRSRQCADRHRVAAWPLRCPHRSRLGPRHALAAFQRLDNRERAALLFVGDGPLRAEIEAHAVGMPNVSVTGFRNQSELPREYAVADVLLLPSEFEPWGLVVNEALNFGLAVVASDQVGAATDLVRAEDGGHIVPVGDVAALSRVMHRRMEERPGRPRTS